MEVIRVWTKKEIDHIGRYKVIIVDPVSNSRLKSAKLIFSIVILNEWEPEINQLKVPEK